MKNITTKQLDKMFPVEAASDGKRFACVVPTWRARPDQTVEEYLVNFQSNWHMSAGSFGCRPSQDGTRYVRNFKLLQAVANEHRKHPLKEDGTWHEWFKPADVVYYAHLDLSVAHDATGLAVASWHPFTPRQYEIWRQGQISLRGEKAVQPLDGLKDQSMPDEAGYVKVDLALQTLVPIGDEIRLWRARELLFEMSRMGFMFGKVTADQYQSRETMQRLNDAGIPSGHFSVDANTAAYDRFMELSTTELVDFYPYQPFLREMEELLLLKGKVDHPKHGSKDVADAVVGAVYWAYELGRVGPAVR